MIHTANFKIHEKLYNVLTDRFHYTYELCRLEVSPHSVSFISLFISWVSEEHVSGSLTTFWSPVVTIYTILFNIQQLLILPTECKRKCLPLLGIEPSCWDSSPCGLLTELCLFIRNTTSYKSQRERIYRSRSLLMWRRRFRLVFWKHSVDFSAELLDIS